MFLFLLKQNNFYNVYTHSNQEVESNDSNPPALWVDGTNGTNINTNNWHWATGPGYTIF